jgi:hypothetical protein
MASKTKAPEWLISDHEGLKASGYDDWKRRKIEQSLAESQDRSKLIPADKVWRKLGFED